MWYVTGALNGQGEIVGTEHRFTWDEGVTPCAAFDAAGRVLIVYSNADNGDLSYVYGTFNGEGAVAGQKFSLTTATGKRRGYMPSAAFYSRTGVIIMYQGTEDEKIWYVYGNIDPTTRFSGSERLLDMSFNRW